MPERVPVLIVGAGPVGLSLALGLARCGIKSVVIEKNASTSEQSRAPGIWSRTLEIFAGWDVAAPMLSAGTYLPDVEVWGVGDSAPRVEISFDELQSTTPYPGILILPQSKTEAILRKRLDEEPLCDLRFSHELLLLNHIDDAVRTRISTPNGEIELEAEYLVGCDGGHSAVRKGVGLALTGKTYEGRVALADVKIGGEYPWPRVGTADGPLIALNLGEGLWRIIAISSEAAADGGIDDAELDVWVKGMFGETAYERVWTSTFQIHSRVCRTFRRDRVLLAGDAAHLNSPAGGQGMNAGVQDAHNLAWKLAAVLNGGKADKLLDSYDVERQHAVRQFVNRTTDFLTRAVMGGGSLRRDLFAHVVPSMLKIRAVRQRALRRMTMLDIRYPESPLFPVADGRVGRRIPNCLVKDVDGANRLHDLVRDGPCLLGLGTDEAATPQLPIRQQTLLPSMAALLFEELQITGPTFVLLRPDGFIGLVLEGSATLGLESFVAAALGES